MVNALKRMDKKFLIFAGLIICLPLLLIVFLAIVQGCGDKKVSYETYETKMISALERYINDTDKVPTEEGKQKTVKLSTLVSKGYIKSTEKLLDDDSCDGSVSVRRNGSSLEQNNGGFLNYTVELNCKNHKTVHLLDKVMENLVTEESGLYKTDDGYVFKGNKVNNYINFYGNTYRIMSIDTNGILKLVKNEPESTNRIWDNKFNVETNRSSGKNIYKDSVILEFLLNDYFNAKKINSKTKKQIVAYDVCVGKRNSNNYAIDKGIDCSEKLENQVISLLNVSDYANASLDADCTSLNSRSCNNYNYLYGSVSSTWTLNASLDNGYDVLYLADGIMFSQVANTYSEYNIVIYIDGNQLYTLGNGSSNNPYVIE